MSNRLRLSLNPESANALREFANAMPLAVENIVESTNKLFQVYQSQEEKLGPHKEDFYKLLTYVKKAQEESAEAIEKLPIMLRNTADKIDEYLRAHPVQK